MTLKQQLTQATQREMTVSAEEATRVADIQKRIPGWSGCGHYAFFRELLALPVRDVLVLGVYHGRDLALMRDILEAHHPNRQIEIVGVDRFTADPCADWTPTRSPRTWEEETHGYPPPSFSASVQNVETDSDNHNIHVIASDDFTFLDTTHLQFDAVYLDTSHDYGTVRRQLRQVRRVIRPGAVICGDDFSDQHTWGVKSAVEQTFKEYLLFAGWIWAAFLEDSK